jgi:hypothetical protein
MMADGAGGDEVEGSVGWRQIRSATSEDFDARIAASFRRPAAAARSAVPAVIIRAPII